MAAPGSTARRNRHRGKRGRNRKGGSDGKFKKYNLPRNRQGRNNEDESPTQSSRLYLTNVVGEWNVPQVQAVLRSWGVSTPGEKAPQAYRAEDAVVFVLPWAISCLM